VLSTAVRWTRRRSRRRIRRVSILPLFRLATRPLRRRVYECRCARRRALSGVEVALTSRRARGARREDFGEEMGIPPRIGASARKG
jgi:hypothetical protein